jgi:hypothetical protein
MFCLDEEESSIERLSTPFLSKKCDPSLVFFFRLTELLPTRLSGCKQNLMEVCLEKATGEIVVDPAGGPKLACCLLTPSRFAEEVFPISEAEIRSLL